MQTYTVQRQQWKHSKYLSVFMAMNEAYKTASMGLHVNSEQHPGQYTTFLLTG